MRIIQNELVDFIWSFSLHSLEWTFRQVRHKYLARLKTQHDKARFLDSSETQRIPLFREHSSRTNDMDTIEYATFRYTVEVENGLN